jgi:hypothetical protein
LPESCSLPVFAGKKRKQCLFGWKKAFQIEITNTVIHFQNITERIIKKPIKFVTSSPAKYYPAYKVTLLIIWNRSIYQSKSYTGLEIVEMFIWRRGPLLGVGMIFGGDQLR